MADIELRTLTDGGQRAEDVAADLIAFFEAARTSLDIAIYDIRLGEEIERRGREALERAHERGVDVRLVYELEDDDRPPVPPPPRTPVAEVEETPFPTHGVGTSRGLMHHKYVVRDGRDVWTGTTNWTTDSWTRQENVIVTVASEGIARAYGIDFEQLWGAENVERAGRVEPRPVDVGGIQVRAWFCPGYGEELAHRIAKHLGKAQRRIRIASPVLSSGPILCTLVEIVNERRCTVAGVVDDTQLDEVFRQWQTNGVSEWKIPLLRRVLEGGEWAGKESTPWSPSTLHDFMHAKVTVADDVAFVGSFNLSRSGERNAENVLEIRDRAIADRLADYVDLVRGLYPPVSVPILTG